MVEISAPDRGGHEDVEKQLNVNVIFTPASTYTTAWPDVGRCFHALCSPCPRISGWTAPDRTVADKPVVRPRADYTGPVYRMKYVGMGMRIACEQLANTNSS